MKAMILAAGLGKRMRPLTDTLPKPLIPVRGKPLIAYHLEALARAGIAEVIINLAYRGAQIQEFVGDGSAWGLQVVYSQEPEPLETGGAIVHAAGLLGSEPFILVNADIFTDFDFKPLLKEPLTEDSLGRLVVVPNPGFKPTGDFGVGSDGCLQKLEGGDGYTFAGISLLRPALVLDYPGRRRCFGLAEALLYSVNSKLLSARVYSGRWCDVGTPERLHSLCK